MKLVFKIILLLSFIFLGDFIASGCNGAVLQLRLRNDLKDNNNEMRQDHSCKVRNLI
jgi:hypothetical protein